MCPLCLPVTLVVSLYPSLGLPPQLLVATLSFFREQYSQIPQGMRTCHICLSLPSVFHLAQCPPGSPTLLQMTGLQYFFVAISHSIVNMCYPHFSDLLIA